MSEKTEEIEILRKTDSTDYLSHCGYIEATLPNYPATKLSQEIKNNFLLNPDHRIQERTFVCIIAIP